MPKQSQFNIFSKVNFRLDLVRQKLKFEIYHQSNPPKLVGLTEATLG